MGSEYIKKFKAILFSLGLMTYSVFAQDEVAQLEGIWKHAHKEAWLTIDVAEGTASVFEHKGNRDAKGSIVIQHIQLVSANNWKGKMYAAATDSFVDVDLALEPKNTVIVRYMGKEVLTLVR